MQREKLSKHLLDWYAEHGRVLPWRHRGGGHPDPYVILVSEFMLQQTGVKTVIPYFHRFMERFPNVETLASATDDDVYLYWQGLGYYSRARSLHATAKMIVNEFGGRFPNRRADVLKLPGVGPYTAASFLALAFNQPESVVDGNVIRVISRLYRLTGPVTENMDVIRERAAALTDPDAPADYASAIMDLGATICTPKNPGCDGCPWAKFCAGRAAGDAEAFPESNRPVPKSKSGRVYLITNKRGDVFMTKRPGRGLLSGLYEFPWTDDGSRIFKADWRDIGASVSHTFTHFKLNLKIQTLSADRVPMDGKFVRPSDLSKYPMSTLMKKVIERATAVIDTAAKSPRLAF